MSSALSVLLVDDHRDCADSFFELLRVYGYETKVVYTSLDALASLADQMPDVFIADIGLPHLDGCELATRMAAMDLEMPLMIAVTGYPNLRDRCRLAGFDHFFLKPADPNEILALLQEEAKKRQKGSGSL